VLKTLAIQEYGDMNTVSFSGQGNTALLTGLQGAFPQSVKAKAGVDRFEKMSGTVQPLFGEYKPHYVQINDEQALEALVSTMYLHYRLQNEQNILKGSFQFINPVGDIPEKKENYWFWNDNGDVNLWVNDPNDMDSSNYTQYGFSLEEGKLVAKYIYPKHPYHMGSESPQWVEPESFEPNEKLKVLNAFLALLVQNNMALVE